MKIVVTAAALAASLAIAATPAMAENKPGGTPYQVGIPVWDLDLASAAGQQAYMKRAREAADEACGPGLFFRGSDAAAAEQCRTAFLASAKNARDERYGPKRTFAQAGMK